MDRQRQRQRTRARPLPHRFNYLLMNDVRCSVRTPHLLAFLRPLRNAAKEIVYLPDAFYGAASIVRLVEDAPAMSEVISEVDDEIRALVEFVFASKIQAALEIRNIANVFQNCSKVSRIGRVWIRGRPVRYGHVRVRSEQPSQTVLK